MRSLITTVLIGVALGCGGRGQEVAVVDEEVWRAEVEAWHSKRIARLHEPDGWLSLVGLEWLEPGVLILGAGEEATARLPRGPARVGELEVRFADAGGGAEIRLRPDAGVEVLVDGEAVPGEVELRTDANASPSVIGLGSLRVTVIERGDQLALRIKDTEAPLLSTFEGIERFPLDPAWRIVARFEPYDPPKPLPVPTAAGTVEEVLSPGAVSFRHAGVAVRFDAQPGGQEGTLFLVFGDTTNGTTTYGGGRFVYSEPPSNGTVVVDFNRAYNPPCVFTPYSTCPLPQPDARFPFSVEVGEKIWAEKR